MVIKMVGRMRKIMEAYASTASQPQIMATNNAFKIVLLNVNFTADYFTAFATQFQTSLLQCSTVG